LQFFKSNCLSGSNPAMPHSLFHDPSNAPQAATSLSRQAKATTVRNGCNREAFAAVHVAAPEIGCCVGVVTLSAISLISAIEQQAKSLKSHTTTLTFIGEFRSI
jgi:hypothetical protein